MLARRAGCRQLEKPLYRGDFGIGPFRGQCWTRRLIALGYSDCRELRAIALHRLIRTSDHIYLCDILQEIM
jgi:hypothetical protein